LCERFICTSEQIKTKEKFQMNQFKITTVMLGLLSACLAPSIRADDFNKETHLTTNGTLQIQDILLAPGQYTLRLALPDSNETVVSIYNADGTRLEGIVMGWPAYRTDAGDKKLITVSQPQGSQPGSLKYWFFVGDNFGVEFPVKNLPGEAGRVVSSNGHEVKSKGKGQTGAAADDSSSSGRE
jgi:hypothetical protein